jgi:hypothetical protein
MTTSTIPKTLRPDPWYEIYDAVRENAYSGRFVIPLAVIVEAVAIQYVTSVSFYLSSHHFSSSSVEKYKTRPCKLPILKRYRLRT